MSGSDKIIEKILSDAKAEADAIVSEAKKKAGETVKSAGLHCEQDLAAKKADADNADRLARENSDSSAELIVRNMLLRQRRAEIDATKDLMLKKFEALPDDEYFAAILRLAQRGAMSGRGVMLLSPADEKRAPKPFKDALLEISGGITVEASDRVENGFVLCYGNIEINCGFKAMMEDRVEQIEDFINKELF